MNPDRRIVWKINYFYMFYTVKLKVKWKVKKKFFLPMDLIEFIPGSNPDPGDKQMSNPRDPGMDPDPENRQ